MASKREGNDEDYLEKIDLLITEPLYGSKKGRFPPRDIGIYFSEDEKEFGADAEGFGMTFGGQTFAKLSLKQSMVQIVVLYLHQKEKCKYNKDGNGYMQAFVKELKPIANSLVKIIHDNKALFRSGVENEFTKNPIKPIGTTSNDMYPMLKRGRAEADTIVDLRRGVPRLITYWSTLLDSIAHICQTLGLGDLITEYDIRDGRMRPEHRYMFASQIYGTSSNIKIGNQETKIKIAKEIFDLAYKLVRTDYGRLDKRADAKKVPAKIAMRQRHTLKYNIAGKEPAGKAPWRGQKNETRTR